MDVNNEFVTFLGLMVCCLNDYAAELFIYVPIHSYILTSLYKYFFEQHHNNILCNLKSEF